MPTGYVSILGVRADDGTLIPAVDAAASGIINPSNVVHPSWLPSDELPLGGNNFTNLGRKYLAYLFGGRTPMSNYVCTSFGAGTGDTKASVSDVSLVSPVLLGSTNLKAVDSITFPEDYVAFIQFTIGSGEANGYLLREFGLFSGDGTLLARKTGYNLNKVSGYAPVLHWRIKC